MTYQDLWLVDEILTHLMQMTSLTADSKGKLKELLDKVIYESKKERVIINCKKTKCMVVSKRDNQLWVMYWGCKKHWGMRSLVVDRKKKCWFVFLCICETWNMFFFFFSSCKDFQINMGRKRKIAKFSTQSTLKAIETGKQCARYLMSFSKWITEQVPQRQWGVIKEQELLIAIKDEKQWKIMTDICLFAEYFY